MTEPTLHLDHPLASNQPPQLVTTQSDLLELLGHLREARSFAFDSEFIGELSYVPKLCLIQVASASRVSLIDPLSDLDLQPFWEIVTDPAVEKIVHAGQQDIEPVFRNSDRPPVNLFDTQIAGGFVGLGYPLALSKLVYAVLGVKLSKGLTFSHWDRRPLSDHQLRYAADDVRYLVAVRHEFGKCLDALGHAAWAAEESAGLADPSLYQFDPDSQFLKIRGAGGLPPRNLAILRELAIWRDQCARADDVPPRSFLKDEIVLDLARNPVEAVAELSRIRGLPRPVEINHGQTLVQAIARAKNLTSEQLPTIRNHEPGPQEKFQADSLFYAMQCLCAGRQIDPSLVAGRSEIGELSRLLAADETINKSANDLRILQGWRRQAIGEPLVALLKAKLDLSLRWETGVLKTSANRL
jgi:ribonuclease D